MAPNYGFDLASMDSFLLKKWLVDVKGLTLTDKDAPSKPPIVLQKQTMELLIFLSTHHRTIIKSEQLIAALFPQSQMDDQAIKQMIDQLCEHFGSGQQVIQVLGDHRYMLTADPLPPEGAAPPPEAMVIYHLSEFDRKKRFSIAIVMAFLVFSIALAMLLPKPGKQTEGPVQAETHNKLLLAILPFEHDSQNPMDDYLAEGLSDVLTSRLTGFDGWQMIARHSAFAFRGKYTNGVQIGSLLGASHAVKGQIAIEQGNLKLSVELLSIETDSTIWKKHYQQHLGNLTELHNQLSKDIQSQMNTVSGHNSLPLTDLSIDPQIFDHYLAALFNLNKQQPNANQTAQKQLQRVLEQSPQFSPAKLALAQAIIQQHELGALDTITTVDKTLKVLASVKQSEQHSQLLALKAQLHHINGTLDRAEQNYQEALDLAPDHSKSHMLLGILYQQQKHFKQARQHLLKAIKIDPMRHEINHYLGQNLLFQGQLESGMEYLTRAIDSTRADAHIEVEMAHWYHQYGIADKTSQWAEVAYAKTPDDPQTMVAMAQAQSDLSKQRYWANLIQNAEKKLENAFFALASLYFYSGNTLALTELLGQQQDKQNHKVLFWQGLVYMQQQQYSKAMEALKPLVEYDFPGHWPPSTELTLYNQLAYGAKQLGDNQAARQYLQKGGEIKGKWMVSGLRTPMLVSEMMAHLLLSGQDVKAQQLLKNVTAKNWKLDHFLDNNPILSLLTR